MNRNIRHGSDGQAMIELMAGMVAVLALVAGVLVGTVLISAHGKAMVEARQKAGALAMMNVAPGMDIVAGAKYIKHWSPGADKKRMTPDDVNNSGDTVSFQAGIVNQTVADQGQWDTLDKVPNSHLSRLHQDSTVINSFGLVRGYSKKVVNMSNQADWVPVRAYQHLLNAADVIDVEGEVWLPLVKGVY